MKNIRAVLITYSLMGMSSGCFLDSFQRLCRQKMKTESSLLLSNSSIRGGRVSG